MIIKQRLYPILLLLLCTTHLFPAAPKASIKPKRDIETKALASFLANNTYSLAVLLFGIHWISSSHQFFSKGTGLLALKYAVGAFLVKQIASFLATRNNRQELNHYTNFPYQCPPLVVPSPKDDCEPEVVVQSSQKPATQESQTPSNDTSEVQPETESQSAGASQELTPAQEDADMAAFACVIDEPVKGDSNTETELVLAALNEVPTSLYAADDEQVSEQIHDIPEVSVGTQEQVTEVISSQKSSQVSEQEQSNVTVRSFQEPRKKVKKKGITRQPRKRR